MANQLVKMMVEGQVVVKQEEELYLYGLETLIASLVNTCLTLSIGAILGYFVETLVFLAFYCPIRQFAGGYHASTYLKCTLSFITLFTLTVVGYMEFGEQISAIHIAVILLISCIVITILAPVEDKNKPLELLEKKRYKERAIKIMCLDVTVIAILLTGNEFVVRLCVFGTLALAWLALLVLLGFIKNLSEGKKRRNTQ